MATFTRQSYTFFKIIIIINNVVRMFVTWNVINIIENHHMGIGVHDQESMANKKWNS